MSGGRAGSRASPHKAVQIALLSAATVNADSEKAVSCFVPDKSHLAGLLLASIDRMENGGNKRLTEKFTTCDCKTLSRFAGRSIDHRRSTYL